MKIILKILNRMGVALVGVLVAAVLAIFLVPFVIGLRHYDGNTGTCPDATPQFYESAVRDYFIRNGKGTDDIEFIPGSVYDSTLSSIAFRKGGQKYLALVDCKGGLELSLQ
ncbi:MULTISPECIES: hypothetical protein [Cupriavidus]